MFSKDKPRKDKPKAERASSAVPPSIVSTDLKIIGDMVSEGEIQIDGTLEGDVKCRRLSVGASGHIKGAVFVDTALVRGKIEGQIKAKDITLTRTSRVIGDILHETLTIEPGARLEGHCRRMEPSAQKPAADANFNLVVSETKQTAAEEKVKKSVA